MPTHRFVPSRSPGPRTGFNPGLSRRGFLRQAAAALATSATLGLSGCAGRGTRGAAVRPFNGRDLAGFQSPTGDWQTAAAVTLDPGDPTRLLIEPGTGVLVNGTTGRTVDLLTVFEPGDVEAHIEFLIPRQSNSGLYFMGRYEIQIYDSYGTGQDKYPGIECGGIYPRWRDGREFEGHSPRVNASRPPGQWQVFDVQFRAPRFDAAGVKRRHAAFIRVLHNGQLIHENVELTGPTRAARWEQDEQATGPLMLQGDHGPVAYRNLLLRPLTLP